jgi:hypothetical protein
MGILRKILSRLNHMASIQRGRSLWVSFPILREYLAVVTRPQATSPVPPMGTAIADV